MPQGGGGEGGRGAEYAKGLHTEVAGAARGRGNLDGEGRRGMIEIGLI